MKTTNLNLILNVTLSIKFKKKAFQFSIQWFFLVDTLFVCKLQKIEMLFFVDVEGIPNKQTTRTTIYKPTTSY